MSYFYNTWWFYAMIVLSVAGYIVARWKIVKLERSNLEMARVLHAKAVELQDNAEKLKRLEKTLSTDGRTDEQMIAVLLHDLRSPLRFLCTISKSVVKGFTSSTMDRNLDQLNKLHNSVGSLWNFVEASYVWVKSQENDFQLSIQAVSVQEIFQRVTELYGGISTCNGNELVVIATQVCWSTDQDVVTLIVRNLLDNANKFTENGHIWLSCHETAGKLRIVVEDTGRGLTDLQIRSFIQATDRSRKGGTGHRVISQMLKKIDGRLLIESQPGQGSVFTVELPRLPLSG